MPETPLPAPGYGTYLLDRHETAENVTRAIETGYRHVDTAQIYGNESEVGDGIEAATVERDDVFLATKVSRRNLAYEDFVESVYESRDRLDVDVIDLLYIHWPSTTYDAESSLAALDDVRDDGLVEHVGLSNFTPALLEEAIDILDAPVFAHQIELHPLFQQRELRELGSEHDHYVVSYSPIARARYFDHPVIDAIATDKDATPAQVMLAWHLAHDLVPIPKARGDHVDENFGCVDVDLTPEDVARIDDIDEQHRIVDPGFGPW